jgi:hypothetical protein
MNRILRPGVCLIFLVTGMSAAALSEARNPGGAGRPVSLEATGTHLKFLTAAILCHGATIGTGLHPDTVADSSGDVFEATELSSPMVRVGTLGSAKLWHFGRLSARKV